MAYSTLTLDASEVRPGDRIAVPTATGTMRRRLIVAIEGPTQVFAGSPERHYRYSLAGSNRSVWVTGTVTVYRDAAPAAPAALTYAQRDAIVARVIDEINALAAPPVRRTLADWFTTDALTAGWTGRISPSLGAGTACSTSGDRWTGYGGGLEHDGSLAPLRLVMAARRARAAVRAATSKHRNGHQLIYPRPGALFGERAGSMFYNPIATWPTMIEIGARGYFPGADDDAILTALAWSEPGYFCGAWGVERDDRDANADGRDNWGRHASVGGETAELLLTVPGAGVETVPDGPAKIRPGERTVVIDALNRPDAVAAYLPGNYRVVRVSAGRYVTIAGTDRAGWTLDGYVLPRLASGLYFPVPPMSGGSPWASAGSGWHADGCLCRACSALSDR